MSTEHVITFIIGSIVAFAVIMYVVLDGFDLGIGILFPFMKDDGERDIALSTIVPIWDGNETWLVLGGATLYGGFPIVYSTVLPTLYLPIMIMLISLVTRGVSFEFIHKSQTKKHLWQYAFFASSTLAAFCQGMVLGTFVMGFSDDGVLTSTLDYHWLSGFSVFTGLALIFGYALLGATWLIGKTVDNFQAKMFQFAKNLLVVVAFFMVTASLWTPYVDPEIYTRWYSMPNTLLLSPLPIVTGLLFIWQWRCLQQGKERIPFLQTIGLFLLAYLGFAISIYPYIIPHAVTVWEAAAPLKAQIFILVGLAILLPVLVGYTFYQYYVFRGKITHADTHY